MPPGPFGSVAPSGFSFGFGLHLSSAPVFLGGGGGGGNPVWNPAPTRKRRSTAFPALAAPGGAVAAAGGKPYAKLAVSSTNVFDLLWREVQQSEAKKRPIAEKAVPALEATVDRLLERLVPDVLRFARVAVTPAVGLAGPASSATKPPSDKDRSFAVRAGALCCRCRCTTSAALTR